MLSSSMANTDKAYNSQECRLLSTKDLVLGAAQGASESVDIVHANVPETCLSISAWR